jgi:phosphate transport system permease protein
MADTASQPPAASPPRNHGSLAGGTERLRKRRRAEIRLKAYGITALLIAAGALISLLGSVVFQASGVLTSTYLTYEIELDSDALGVSPSSDPRAIRRADFDALINESLEARFPLAEGRTERRELHGLVSGGASFELAEHVAANPNLIGDAVSFPLVAASPTDLYMQGEYGALREQSPNGRLSVSQGPDGTLSISSSSNDFAEGLRLVKSQLTDDADQLRRQAARQQNAVRVYNERAAAAETEEERTENRESAEQAEARRDELIAQAEALEARAAGAGGAEDVDEENASLLIKAGGGWMRMTEVNRESGRGEMLTEVELPIDDSEAWEFFIAPRPEADRNFSDHQIAWVETLRENGAVERVFNTRFFTAADSRAPELAGIWGAVVGSFWTMLVTFCLAFPIGVLGAIYLEEFAPKNRFTNFVEVNINNLAAVPSIVFGLLGLAVFLGFFGVPRSAPLAGGIVLALMSLPTMIIAARAAIRAVPPSIRDAALAVGASKVQASFHHVLPLAMPGILTGTIIAMAQALGETAPLIMIGMVAFIVDVPSGITDSATVLPVQVYRWSDFPEQAFEAKTAAAICVLLVFLLLMNALAIFLRKRFERRW